MMIVIAIIAILVAAMAYAVAGAQESSKVAKTRALVAKLHSLVMQKYESYRNRRLPVTIPATVYDPATSTVIPTPPRAIAKARCDALRALMKMEMPERWTDITDDPAKPAVPLRLYKPGPPNTKPSTWPAYRDATNPSQFATIAMQRSGASQSYLSFVQSLSGPNATALASDDNQSAKCLYLLVTQGLDEPDVLENFSASEIGDPDHSGCKVFLDAWGNPVRFLRWAPGYTSAVQPDGPAPSASDLRQRDQTDPTGIYGSPQAGSVAGPGRTLGNTFALYPLIFSAGADGHYDVATSLFVNGAPLHYSQTSPPNNPFETLARPSAYPVALGAPMIDAVDRTSRTALGNADNITSHDIGAR